MKKYTGWLVSALVALSFMAQVGWAQNGETVSFVTSDNVRIAGTLWNAGAGKPAVICLHQWRSDRSSFVSLAKLLHGAGMSVLTIDARGYGESRESSTGGSVRPDRDIQPDVQAAVQYLKTTVKPGSLGLLGASYGSSNAIIYAAGSKEIKAIALLSPGLNYFNKLPTEDAITKLSGRRVLAYASSEDVRSVEAVTRYQEVLGKDITTKIYSNIGHGTDMLSGSAEISGNIKEFFSKALQ